MHTQHLPVKRAARRQAGFVNVLLVILAGIGAMALTAVGLHSIRSAQDQQTSLHANTQAVVRAWDGVEVLRRYLGLLSADELKALGTGDLAIQGLANVAATIVSSNLVGDNYRVVADVTGSGVGASATVRITYAVASSGNSGGGGGGAGGTNTSLDSVVHINSDLELTGGIEVLGGDNARLWVSGNVDLSGSVTGIAEICSNGNVSITAGITVTNICSNGSLTLGGSAKVVTATVKGDVTFNGGATSVNTITANGNVTLSGGSASAGIVSTRGSVSVSGNAQASVVSSEGSIDWSSGNSASSLTANGSIAYAGGNNGTVLSSRSTVSVSGNGNVTDLTALGNISIMTNWGLGVQGTLLGGADLTYQPQIFVNTGTVKGSVTPTSTHQNWHPKVNVTSNAALVVNPTTVAVAEINITEPAAPKVDVYALKDSSNYVLEYLDGLRKVTVRNVSGINDGTYYLGDVVRNHNTLPDYLCTSVNASGKCPSAEYDTARTICQGFSANNGCISYASNKATWTLNSQSMAPGIVWVDGNLSLSNGTYFNSFAAAGDISTAGSMKTYAPNYAGYNAVCADTGTSTYGVTRDSRLSGLYPKQFCGNGSYTAVSLGNVALIAGGYKGDTYVGGNINLGASNEIYGSVIAGNLLTTTGNTTVHGHIQVGGQGSAAKGKTKWTGHTTIDLRNRPSSYDPSDVPCMDDCTNGGGGGGGGGAASATIYWTSYR